MILHYVDKVKESTDKRDLLWLSAKERVLIEKYRNSGDKAKYLMQIMPLLAAEERDFVMEFVDSGEKLRKLVQATMILGKQLAK